MGVPTLPDDTYIVGVVRHTVTGAYIVVMCLGGDDVDPVAAFDDREAARTAQRETLAAIHQLAAVVENTDTSDAEAQQRGMALWADFLDRMYQKSTADISPLTPEHLAYIEGEIATVSVQSAQAPPVPDGFNRVLTYSPQALAGEEMPSVRLTPIDRKPEKGRQ